MAVDWTTLVLIDLDRSIRADTGALIISSEFCSDTSNEPENEMYRLPRFVSNQWTAKNLDWKQVGLLFHRLFKDDTDHRDYKICMPFFEKHW